MSDAPVIPKTCKAGVCTKFGKDFVVEVQDVPVPTPGPDELLIKLGATGICYSDLHYMIEDLAMPKMGQFGVRSPGHEGSGVVVAMGANVKGWKIGDRGGIKPMWDTCGNCEYCHTADWETHCAKAESTGLSKPGTYQQYLTSPARYTTRIPDNVDDFSAGPIMCSGSTIYHSLLKSRLKAGQWAVFPGGGGGVGHMGIQYAHAMGLRCIGIDTGADKKALCLKLGCEYFIDFVTEKDVVAKVIELTKGGADGVFVTATNKGAYQQAPMMMGVGGKVMCIGLPPTGLVEVGADPSWFIFKGMSVIGTLVGSMEHTREALLFAERGLVKPVYTKYPISRLPEAVYALRDGKVTGRCVVDFNDES